MTPHHVPPAVYQSLLCGFWPVGAETPLETPPVFGSKAKSRYPAFAEAGAVTRALAVDTATELPASLAPVTLTRSVVPMSSSTTVRELAVAPGRSMHAVPSSSHVCHWYAKAIGASPVHAPVVTDSTWSSRAVPVMLGAVVFAGPAGTGVATGS